MTSDYADVYTLPPILGRPESEQRARTRMLKEAGEQCAAVGHVLKLTKAEASQDCNMRYLCRRCAQMVIIERLDGSDLGSQVHT